MLSLKKKISVLKVLLKFCWVLIFEILYVVVGRSYDRE